MPWAALHKDQKGAAAVEFAIILPILVIILLGIFDFALLFYNKQVLTNASRELARYAIVEKNAEDDPNFVNQKDYIKDFCNDKLISLGGASEVVIGDIDVVPLPTNPDDYIEATIEFQYHHLFSNILGFLNFSTTPLTGRTVMRNE